MRTTSNWVLSVAAWLARALPRPVVRGLYRVGPVASLLRDWLNRAAPHGITRVTVASGGLEGFRMALDLQTEKDYWLGTYETQLQEAINDLASQGTVAYDVGANIGYTSLLLAKAVGEAGRVYAFEALPANLDRLRQNLALSGLGELVTVVPAAVLDSSGPVRFLAGDSGSTGQVEGSAGRVRPRPEALDVAGLSLDEFVYASGNPPPDLVKMDIEGGEVRALPGMRRLLLEAGPTLLLELHGPESAKEAYQILGESGYRLRRMEPGYPPAGSVEELGWKAYIVGTR